LNENLSYLAIIFVIIYLFGFGYMCLEFAHIKEQHKLYTDQIYELRTGQQYLNVTTDHLDHRISIAHPK